MSNAQLVTIRVTTKMGATYLFPDLELPALEKMCKYMQDGVPMGASGQLSLVNASISLLSVPFRIIKTIEVTDPDDESMWREWWKAPEREDECYPVSTVKKT